MWSDKYGFGCKHNDTVDLSRDLVFVCMKPGG